MPNADKNAPRTPAKRARLVLLEVLAIALFLLFMSPFIVVLINASRTNNEIINKPVAWPSDLKNFTDNFVSMWNNETFAFPSAFMDSTIITFFSLVLICMVSSMAAWVLCRNKARWSTALYIMFLGAMVIPFQVVMFPLISWFRGISNVTGIPMLRSYIGIIFAYVGFGESMSIFIFHGFVKGIPLELEEAAQIDGCSQAGIFFRIVFPLLQPVMITVLVLNGLWIWNDYLLPLLVLGTSDKVRTIPLAVQGFMGAYVKQWNLIMMSTLMAMLPVIILYIFAQKYIVKGMVEGAGK